MKYEDTKPIPRKVAIKNYLLKKRPYKAPQEQNDGVKQILAENKPKIRKVAQYLMNGWKENINNSNLHGKVVVSRKNKYFTSKNVVHTANNIDTKDGTIKQGAPYLTKKQVCVATAVNELNNNRLSNVNNGNQQTFGGLRKYEQNKNTPKNKENDTARIKRNFQPEKQPQQKERPKYRELCNTIYSQHIDHRLSQMAEKFKRSVAEARLINDLNQIEKDFVKLKQNNGNIDGCFNLPNNTIDINLDGDHTEIDSRQSLMSINSFIDGFLPNNAIDTNRGGQAVDNRAETDGRLSLRSKKGRSDCCRVC